MSTWFSPSIKAKRLSSRPFFVPKLELLEGRTVPSTFTVLNLADSGSGSLRAAVLAAEANPGADSINFAEGVTGTITLTSGQMTIRSELTITGPGDDQLTVSGNDSSRIFRIIGGGDEGHRISVSISGLTLSHGSALNFGGAIANVLFSSLALSNVTLSDNHSLVLPGFDGGGAVFNASPADLTVTKSFVVQNTAEGAAGSLTVGGSGIFNAFGSVAICNSLVASNLTNATAGLFGVGGGIVSLGGRLTISNSSITDNQVLGGPRENFGGGVCVLSNGSLTVLASTVSNNLLAGPTACPNTFGGGIYVKQSTALISGSRILDNEVSGGTGTGVFSATGGGGLVLALSTGTITNSILQGNRAAGGGLTDGGAIGIGRSNVSVDSCTISNNVAIAGGGSNGEALGGAISISSGSFVSVTRSVLEGNRAIGGSGGSGGSDDAPIGSALGGGIANVNAELEISQSLLRHNQAIGGNNTVSTAPNTAEAGGADGGAIGNTLGAQTVIRNSIIEHNQAIGGNGNRATGPTAFAGTGAGGGINNQFDGAAVGLAPTRVTVIDCTLRANEAIGGNDNTATGTVAFAGAGLGGGIANYFGTSTDIISSKISHNRAVGGAVNSANEGAVLVSLGTGGAIFNALGSFVLDTGNILGPSIVNVTNSTLDHNQAHGGDGGLANPGGDGWGGAIANLFVATTNVTSTAITNDLALGGDGNGGGNGLGGGAFNDATSLLTLKASIVTGNHANGGDGAGGGADGQGIGGGIYNLGTFFLDALTIVRFNHASTSDDDIFGSFVPI
jgi:hypothetical protein